MKFKLHLILLILLLFNTKVLPIGISYDAADTTFTIYKGQKLALWSFQVSSYDDDNGDGIAQTTISLMVFDDSDKHWASLRRDWDVQMQLIPPQYLYREYTGNQHRDTVWVDGSNLMVGNKYTFRARACSELSGGSVGTRVCVMAPIISVHIVPYPIDLNSITAINGSYKNIEFIWNPLIINNWQIEHLAIFKNDTDSVTFENLSQCEKFKTNISPTTTQLTIYDGKRNVRSHYAIAGYDNYGEIVALSNSMQPAYPKNNFSLTEPFDGQILSTLTPSLKWHSINGETYTVWYTEDSSFSTKTEVDGITDTTYTITSGITDHSNYYWKVKTSSDVWSNETGWEFKTNVSNIAPSDFELSAPANETTLNKKLISFNWNTAQDSADSVIYFIHLASSISFTDTILYDSTFSTEYHNFFPLTDDKTYFWHVLAKDSHNESVLSKNGLSFTINYNDRPQGFSLDFPRFNISEEPTETDLFPTFIWHPSSDLDGERIRYTLTYSIDSTFTEKTRIENLTDTSYTPLVPLIEDKHYFWKVTAYDGSGNSRLSYGKPFGFVTNEANREPSSTPLIYPEQDRVIDPTDITFDWQRPEEDLYDYIFYDLWYSKDSTFSTRTEINDILIQTFYDAGELNAGKYFWKIIAHSKKLNMNDGGSSESVVQSFEAGTSYISKVSKPNGGEVWKTTTTKNISWSSTNVDYVIIEFSTNNGKDWQIIENSYPGNASPYKWKVPYSAISDSCLVKVIDANNSHSYDISDGIFRIIKRPIWYVSVEGDDTQGEGSKSFPFATITHAIDISEEEDSIRVANGIYDEKFALKNNTILTGGFDPKTWERDLDAYDTKIITNKYPIIDVTNSNKFIIDGFLLDFESNSLNRIMIKKEACPSSWDSYIKNCKFLGRFNPAIYIWCGGSIWVENCIFQSYGTYKAEQCISIDAPNVEINNCIFSNTINQAILASYQYGGKVVKIKNCTFNMNKMSRDYAIEIRDRVSMPNNHIIENNIFQNCDIAVKIYDQVSEENHSENAIIKNNIFYNNRENMYQHKIDYNINFSSNPCFFDAENEDYHLKNISPAIGLGLADYAPNIDFGRNMRPNPVGSNPDIGAYENVLASPEPTTQSENIPSGDPDTISFTDTYVKMDFSHSVGGMVTVNYYRTRPEGIDSLVLNKYWDITSDLENGNFSLNLEFTYEDVDTNGFDESLLIPAYFNSTKGEWKKIDSFTLDTVNNKITIQNLTYFTKFTIGLPEAFQQDQALPVVLKNFAAFPGNKTVTLKWETFSEMNNLGFELYRSFSKKDNFEIISDYKINPKLKGVGNSSTKRSYFFVDNNVINNFTYWYKLVDVGIDGSKKENLISCARPSDNFANHQETDEIPDHFVLKQNYPNPFNPITRIDFGIPQIQSNNHTRIEVYSILGEKIKVLFNSSLFAGYYYVQWDGKDNNENIVSSGIYFIVLQNGKTIITKKVTFIR